MLIQEVDRLGLEPLEHRLHDLLDVVRPTVEAVARAVRVDPEAELGRDHHLVTKGSQRLAHELLIREGAVGFGGVKEGHAPLDRRADDLDPMLPIGRRAVVRVEPHAAVPEGRDFQMTASELALLHFSELLCSRERSASGAPSL